MRIIGVIQARLASTRLPGKSLLDVSGKPLIQRVVDRAGAMTTLTDLVVATSESSSDDPLAAFLRSQGVAVHRGSETDVLARTHGAARRMAADVVVRITGDDPLKDPAVMDLVVRLLLEGRADYASNTLEPTYPEGLDVEAFTFQAIDRATRDATLASEREHVTPYIWKHPDRFRLVSVKYQTNLSHLRWTVDYPQDLEFVREVYREQTLAGRDVGLEAVLALLERRPELAALNAGIGRNAGYARSVALDAMESEEHRG